MNYLDYGQRQAQAARQHLFNCFRIGMRRLKKTDAVTDIILVGGPSLGLVPRWLQCKIGAKTFTLDRPEPYGDPFQHAGLRARRYLYAVREIEGAPFVVGDFVARDAW
jgi:hypothetical protein